MRKSVVLLLVLVFLTASSIATPLSVKAESKTILVPDDYPTISSAIGNATDGDTILVRKGTYDGPWNQTLVINKTISLIGEDAESTKIIFHPAWYTKWYFATPLSGYYSSMTIDAEDVKIAGFTILTDGWDINVNGDNAQIIGNIITTHLIMRGSCQTVAYNTITSLYYPNGTIKSYAHVDLHGSYCIATANVLANGTIGIYGSYNTIYQNKGGGSLGTGGDATHNLIFGNFLKDNGGISYGNPPTTTSGGISIAGTGIIVANNTIINSVTGGIGVIWGSGNIVFRNNITNCPAVGLYETDNSRSNLFYANYVANNQWGAKIVSRQSNTTLYHNNFVNNVNQVHCKASETHWGNFDNGEEGNYWSDYNGTDANGDGIGDTPYVIDEGRSDHYPLTAPFNIPDATLQMPEWANLTLPTRPKTPFFPPKLKPFPTPHPSPLQTPSTSPELMPSPLQTPSPQSEPFNTMPVAITSIASVTVVAAGLFVYFKKRRAKSGDEG